MTLGTTAQHGVRVYPALARRVPRLLHSLSFSLGVWGWAETEEESTVGCWSTQTSPSCFLQYTHMQKSEVLQKQQWYFSVFQLLLGCFKGHIGLCSWLSDTFQRRLKCFSCYFCLHCLLTPIYCKATALFTIPSSKLSPKDLTKPTLLVVRAVGKKRKRKYRKYRTNDSLLKTITTHGICLFEATAKTRTNLVQPNW